MSGTAQQYPSDRPTPTDPTSLFPPDEDADRYAGTALETRTERIARHLREAADEIAAADTGAHRIPPVAPEEFTRILAYQSEQFDRYANDTAVTISRREIALAQEERQRLEDIRANHRNLNRMLTLIGALMIGLVVTYVLTHGYLGHVGVALAPYAFVITVLLDSSLAAYSFIRHY